MTHPPLSLILADDDSELFFFLKHILKDLSIACEIVHLKDGAHLIEFLSKEYRHFDGILLDMNMPNMGGMEVLAELRKRNLRPEIPVIVISQGNPSEPDLAKLRLDAAAYLEKPLGLAELRTFVQKAIAHFTGNSELPPELRNVPQAHKNSSQPSQTRGLESYAHGK